MTTVVIKIWKCQWVSSKLHIIVLNSSVPIDLFHSPFSELRV